VITCAVQQLRKLLDVIPQFPLFTLNCNQPSIALRRILTPRNASNGHSHHRSFAARLSGQVASPGYRSLAIAVAHCVFPGDHTCRLTGGEALCCLLVASEAAGRESVYMPYSISIRSLNGPIDVEH
jgi:hypothetical protein